MTTDQRYEAVLSWFAANMKGAKSELLFRNEWELLVAVMLSAQCTDARVNMVTPHLFATLPTPQAMAAASEGQILSLITSVSYPNAKAAHLKQTAQLIVERCGGEVPRTMEQLTALPGVGRKTANVMLAVAFGQPAMPVDTHVFRVSARIGLTPKVKTPFEAERILTDHIPQSILSDAHHWILLHGRYICTAINPRCTTCGIREYCLDYAQRNSSIV